MLIADLLLGPLLLLLGRKLFWFSIGVLGFIIGADLGATLASQTSDGTILALALLCGILGAVLAVAFEWLAVVLVVGYMGGGYLLTKNIHLAGAQEPYTWLLFIIGGLIGIAVVAIAFDWALIIISSLVGATLILQHLTLQEPWRTAALAGMVVLGILVQYATTKESNERRGPVRQMPGK